MWVGASQVKGFEKFSWMSDLSAHPPWLRFHMGISRWELYNRNDPNLTLLTHDMATQRILGAGEQWKKGAGLHWLGGSLEVVGTER